MLTGCIFYDSIIDDDFDYLMAEWFIRFNNPNVIEEEICKY